MPVARCAFTPMSRHRQLDRLRPKRALADIPQEAEYSSHHANWEDVGLDRYRLLILRTRKGHKAHEGDGARCRLARGDFFDDRELLSGVGGSHRHDEPATHFKLLNQRRR